MFDKEKNIQIMNGIISQLQKAIKENIDDVEKRERALLSLFETSCAINSIEGH